LVFPIVITLLASVSTDLKALYKSVIIIVIIIMFIGEEYSFAVVTKKLTTLSITSHFSILFRIITKSVNEQSSKAG